jgi:hypothetical protein
VIILSGATGRGQATFREGIDEEQRRYAKALRAPLGSLDLSKPVPDVRTWRYWEPCDPRGEEEFKRLWMRGTGTWQARQRSPAWCAGGGG